MKKILAVLAVGVAVLAGLLSRPGREILTRNRLSLGAFRAAESGDAMRMRQVAGELDQKAQTSCAYNWQAGRLEQLRNGSLSQDNRAYSELVQCTPAYLHLLSVTNPTNRELAGMAVNSYPMSADAVFWLAEAVAVEDRLAAQSLYERVTNLDPKDGLAWCRLGSLRRDAGDLEGALSSFEQCCWNGDLGVNGCWGAGKVYEQLGNVPSAIEIYRQSRWESAQNRADELEKSIRP